MEVTRVEQRAYIKIAVLRGRNTIECHSELGKALGNNAQPYRTVARWVGKFQRGHVSTSDEQRSRRPVSAGINLARAVIEQLMDEDRRWTLLELKRASGIEKRTVQRLLCNELHLRKIAARWVPHALTEVQRWFRYAICSDHFERWLQDGDQFLSRIIAIDEFWAMAYEPELKSQFVEWRHAELPRRQKVLVVRDIIVCHFVPHGRTVTAQYYRDFLVQHGVRDKSPDLVDSAIILPDNARPHKAECEWQLLRRWEELEHSPYSSDISPCDFDFIPKIKEPICGRRFTTREDIANSVRQQVTRFTHGPANAKAHGIQRLPHRWQRVVTVSGDYIEGTLVPGETEKGHLYRLDSGYVLTQISDKITLSNGLAWSLDNRTLYYNDSEARKIYYFDYNLEDGSATNKRVLINYNEDTAFENLGYPDGMTIDIEGKLWVACYAGGCVLRIDPATKTILRKLEMPCKNVTSCCFGGPHFDILYVTTAKAEGVNEPQAGAVFAVTGLGTRGQPPSHFKE
ncbi:regucalcin [Trichonephila clavata]|uniref:Regucalcin n=1 Tax=Trichonephila clavata TaxID=2740835 RepID=A0A8X6HTU1_TRICU|nr:regucalcin [Trichonephila clavata]